MFFSVYRKTEFQKEVFYFSNDEATHEEPEEYIALSSSQNQRPVSIDARNEQDFPSLGNGALSTPLTPAVPLAMRNRHTISGLARTKENFPALGGNSAGGGGEFIFQQKLKQKS